MVQSNIKRKLDCDINTLWNIVTNNNSYEWRSDLSKIEIVDDTHFIEYAKNNYPTFFEITKKETLKEYRFNIENTNMKGTWIGKFTELEKEITELDFTEELKFENPILKVLGKFYLKKQQERYMQDLEKEVKRCKK